MTERTRLVGYIRKSKVLNKERERYLQMSIDVEAFKGAAKHESKDGRGFVTLLARAERVQEILTQDREVTSIIQIVLE